MNVIGKYKLVIQFCNMFMNVSYAQKNHNLITTNGLNFFSNCLIGSEEKINRLCFGTGTTPANVNDNSLEKLTGTAEVTTNIIEGELILNSTIRGSSINNTTEIGVLTNNNTLVSRDVHEKVIVPNSSTVTVDYRYSFHSGAYRTDWETTNAVNVFKIEETEEISSIIETNNDSGYIRKSNLNDVIETEGTYYHDISSSILYIHTTDDENPNHYRILVNYKYRG